MKKNIILPSLLMIAFIGCATVSDLKRVRSEIDQKITVDVSGKIVPMGEKVDAAEEKVAALKT